MLSSVLAFLTPANLMAVVYLVILEGVLSVDNALALAALVRGRLSDSADQKKALRYGIFCAYAFRVAVVFGGVWMLEHVWIKGLAAAYLLYLSLSETVFKKKDEDEESAEGDGVKLKLLTPLLSTIIAVELMDITFSVDSIAAAFSVSDKPAVLIAGAVLGIFLMRFAAQLFIKLIEKFPSLEKAAFVLVGLAGLKIIAQILHYDVDEVVFMSLIFGVVGTAMGIDKLRSKKCVPKDDNSTGKAA